VPHRLYKAVAARASQHCEYCLAPEAVINLEFEVDHIVPQKVGGPDEFGNLALSCRSCNLRKGFAQQAGDPDTGELVLATLFNPRADVWDDHFRLDVMTFKIVGLTARGRATARQLGMNRKKALDARTVWLAHSLFPSRN
jgi:HNH endonuclease